jgi:hypothetical protein
MSWSHLLVGLAGLGLGSFVTHALHLRAGQVKGTAKVLHLSEDSVRKADDAVEAAAQTLLQQQIDKANQSNNKPK